MYKAVIFGGTTEGRHLHDIAHKRNIPVLTCVATEYGAQQLEGGTVRSGRLDEDDMALLFTSERPALVIDATHPYAMQVSENIRAACTETNTEYIRVLRDASDSGGCFKTMNELIDRLKTTTGVVFATLGAKEARELTTLPDYKERLWLRVLPSMDSLSECLSLGYPARHIICMQGPFSKELNIAMFRYADAKILVTKVSGGAGGFEEKLAAARELGMEIFALGRPEEREGVSLDEAKELILGL